MGYIDGIHGAPYIPYMDPMGMDKPEFLRLGDRGTGAVGPRWPVGPASAPRFFGADVAPKPVNG